MITTILRLHNKPIRTSPAAMMVLASPGVPQLASLRPVVTARQAARKRGVA